MIYLAFALAVETPPPPDLSDPYNRAVAELAACARARIETEASTTRQRNMALVDRALTSCRAEEDALRSFLLRQSTAEDAERMMVEINGQMRHALGRYMRRLHSR